LIDTSDFFTPQLPSCTLVLLSGSELLVLKNLMQYAARRINWVQEYRDADYLTPDDTTWDTIEAAMAELEHKLMSDCSELFTLLERIADALDLQTSEFETMAQAQGLIPERLETQTSQIVAEMQGSITELQGLQSVIIGQGTQHSLDLADLTNAVTSLGGTLDTSLTAVEAAILCICNSLNRAPQTNIVSRDLDPDTDPQDYFDYSGNIPDESQGALAELEACQFAQAWYQAGYELITEGIQPGMRWAFDNILPAAAAIITVWTGGLALPALIGIWTLNELIQELFELAYDVAESNLQNWLWNQKEDIVCKMYELLQAGGSGSGLWAQVYADIVAPSTDISPGDKLIVSWGMGPIGYAIAKKAKDENTQKYQSVPEAGFCDACPEPPIQGSDWFAIPVPGADRQIEAIHPGGGGSWQSVCFSLPMYPGYTCVGATYERDYYSGDGNCFWYSKGGCPGDHSLNNDVSSWRIEDYAKLFWCRTYLFNWSEAQSTLLPGSQLIDDWNPGQGTLGGGRVHMWSVNGQTLRFTVKYLIYQGTLP
jgi:hypothetical protein